jgi:hypothetical protein
MRGFSFAREVIWESSAEKIICCCSLRLEKNSEPLAAKEICQLLKSLNYLFLAWPGRPSRLAKNFIFKWT